MLHVRMGEDLKRKATEPLSAMAETEEILKAGGTCFAVAEDMFADLEKTGRKSTN